MENAEFHSSCYRSSDLNLAAGCERIIFRPLQDRVEPSTSDADIASAKERERERVLQQTSQRESVIIAFHPHEAVALTDLKATQLGLPSQIDRLGGDARETRKSVTQIAGSAFVARADDEARDGGTIATYTTQSAMSAKRRNGPSAARKDRRLNDRRSDRRRHG